MPLIASFSYPIMLKKFPKPIIRSKCLAWYSRPFVICPGPSFQSRFLHSRQVPCAPGHLLSVPQHPVTLLSLDLCSSRPLPGIPVTPHSFPLKPGAVVPPLGSPSRPSPVNNESGLPWILSEQWDSGAQSGLAQLMQGDRPSHPTEGSFKARPGSGSCSTLHSMRGVMCAIKLASKAKGHGRLVLA